MAENSPLEDSSEYFGITYDTDENTWQTNRTFNTLGALKPCSSFQQYVAGQPSYVYGKHAAAATARRKAAEKLARARPEIFPGIEATVENLDESSRFMGIPEHLKSDLVSFGVIEHLDNAQNPNCTWRHRRLTALAIPTGTSADTVSILQPGVRDLKCQQDLKSSIATLDMDDPLTTTWSVKGASIRQILFSGGNLAAFSLLALRTATSVHILRVVISGGVLCVKTTLTIPTSHLFRSECAHLAFSPRKPSFLAAVGSDGELLVWRIRQRPDGTLKSYFQGSDIMSSRGSDLLNRDHRLRDDSWKTMIWVSDRDLTLVCDRYHLECWDTSQFKQFRYVAGYTKPASESLPIVDVQVCDFLQSTFFVLTTGKVTMLRLHTDNGGATFEELLSYDHGRHHGDILLRMSVVPHDDDAHLTLFSRQNDLITVLSLNGSTARRVVQHDQLRMSWQGSSLLGLVHRPCPLVERRQKTTRTFTGSDQTFYSQMFLLMPNLSLSGCICYAEPLLDKARDVPEHNYDAVSSSIPNLDNPNRLAPNDDILGNEHGKEKREGYESGVDAPFSTITGPHTRGDLPELQTLHTVPRQRVVNSMASSWKNNVRLNKETLNGLCAKILDHRLSKAKSLDSLIAYAPGVILSEENISKVPLAHQVVKRLREQDFGNTSQWLASPLAASEPLGLAKIGVDVDNFGIDAVYRQLLILYNRPLTSAARGNQRLLKEAVARRVASNLSLAAVGVRLSSGPEEDQGLGITSTPASDALVEGSQLQPSQPLPSSMGVEMSSSAENSLEDNDDPVARSIARLRNLTQISTQSADSTKLLNGSANGLPEILAHWDISIDPSQYSYEGTNAMLAGETLISGSAMSIADREKAARREMKARQREMARQARSEAAVAKQDQQESLVSNTTVSRQRMYQEPTGKGRELAGMQTQRSTDTSKSTEDTENTNDRAARQTTAAEELTTHSSLNEQQPHQPRPQQGSASSQLFTSQPRMPERAKRPAKKRGF